MDLIEKRPTWARADVQFIVGLIVALIIWGLQLIGVTVSLWLGAIVLAIAFALMTRAFWVWEGPSRWHVFWRTATVSVAAAVYVTAIGWQIKREWIKEHPKITTTSQPSPSILPVPPEQVRPTHPNKSKPAPPAQAPITTGPISSGPCSNVQVGGSQNQSTVNCIQRDHLILKPDVSAEISNVLRPFSGRSIRLILNRETPETDDFGAALLDSLAHAGIVLQGDVIHMQAFGPVSGGISIISSRKNPDKDFTDALKDVFVAKHLAKNVPEDSSNNTTVPTIRVTPPD